MDRGTRLLLYGLAGVGVALGVAALVGAGGWPGEPSGCIANHDCYCETFTGGLMQQPANTLSNAGFVIVGLLILGSAGAAGPRDRPFLTHPGYRVLYAAVAIALGLGSVLFHGSMTEWGGWLDLVSMHAFITFLLLYDAAVVVGGRSPRWFFRTWVAVNAGLAVVLWVMDNGYGKFVFGALIVATLALEVAIARRHAVTRDRRWFWAGLGTYLFGNVVWLLSRDGGPLCRPDSLLQGHALWHLTGAAAVWLLYRYLASERVVAAPSATTSGVGASQ